MVAQGSDLSRSNPHLVSVVHLKVVCMHTGKTIDRPISHLSEHSLFVKRDMTGVVYLVGHQ